MKIFDFNPALGGPIVRNKLWFHLAYRYWGVDRTATGSFSEITGKPGHDDGRDYADTLRLTWQMSRKQKLATQYNYSPPYRNGVGIDGNVSVSPEATAEKNERANYTWTNRYTATVTNNLLLEAGLSAANTQWAYTYNDGGVTGPGQAARAFPITGTLYDPWYPNVDVVTGYTRGAYVGGNNNNYSYFTTYVASVSHVTGANSFKAGMDLAEMRARSEQKYRGDWEIRWRNGVPDSVLLRATPLDPQEELSNHGFYAQDVWALKRLSITGGLRFERSNGRVPEQWSGPGTWVPARITPSVKSIPRWTSLSPRFGVSWDVFGDAKTALKVSGGRFAVAMGTGTITAANNPMRQIVSSATARWLGDLNGNHLPDPNELGALSNSLFGTIVPNTTFDPKVLEGFQAPPYSWVYSVTLQRELLPRLSVQASTYQTKFFNQSVTDNLAIGPADFDEFSVVSPQDPRLPGGGGQGIGSLYVIRDDKRPLSNPYTTFAKNYGDHFVTYRGVEASVNWRGPNGNTFAGGFDWGQQYINECYVVDTPQQRFCSRRAEPSVNIRGGLSAKFLGALTLPGRWQVSGALASTRGPEILANWTTRDAASTLRFTNGTRAGLGATPNVTVQLIEPGTRYGERYVQLDLRGSRTFALGKMRYKFNVDLYNAMNSNAVLNQNNAYGPTWLQPSRILEARLFKIGAQLDF